VKRRTIGKRIEGHFEIQFRLVHRDGRCLDSGDQRSGFVADVAKILDGAIHVREVNIQWPGRLIGAKMNGAFLNFRAVDFEGGQVADHLQPRRTGAALRLLTGRGVDKINFGFEHQHARDNSMMPQRVPLNREVDAFGGEKRHRHVAGRFTEANVVYGIGPVQQVDFNATDRAGISGISVQGPIDIILREPGKHEPGDAKQDYQPEENITNHSQATMLRARTIAGSLVSFHIETGGNLVSRERSLNRVNSARLLGVEQASVCKPSV